MIFPRSSRLSRNDEGCKPWESTRKTNLRFEGTPHSSSLGTICEQ
jgi:hypothetical protein